MGCLKDSEIVALLMDEVKGKRRRLLEEHLPLCEECRVRRESFEKALSICSSLREATASEDFESEVWMRLYRDLRHRASLGRIPAAVEYAPAPPERGVPSGFRAGYTRMGRTVMGRTGIPL